MDYDKLKQKYRLPDIEIIDFELEIDKESKFILREIRRKSHEKLENFAKLLEGILQPETSSFSEMCEINSFSEAEKTSIMKVYSRIMKLSRRAVEVALITTEETDAQFVKELFEEWKSIKEGMLEIAKKMKESWGKDSEDDKDLRYLG